MYLQQPYLRKVYGMSDKGQMAEIKNRIQTAIRQNSDRGFIPHTGDIQVGEEMGAILDEALSMADSVHTFDISMTVLMETVELLPRADDSSGVLNDIVRRCTGIIEGLCRTAEGAKGKDYFDKLILASRNHVLKERTDVAYDLLKGTVYLVTDHNQAQKVYDTFEILGTLGSGKTCTDADLISFGMIERLDGKAAADQFLKEHLDVPELRKRAVEQAIAEKQYTYAEKLCTHALGMEERWNLRDSIWPRYLETIYTATSEIEKLTEIVHLILINGEPCYYPKLRKLYEAQGIWEKKKEPLLEKLSTALTENEYATVLIEAGEFARLLDLMDKHHHLIEHYGEQVAEHDPEAAYEIYETYILDQAKEATDREKYESVCEAIHNYFKAGAKTRTLELIDRLSGMYPHRAAMLDELWRLREKLVK